MKLSDAKLMLFHDRELDAGGAREVHVGRLVDAGVNARLDSLTALGDAVRTWALRSGVDARAERRRAERARRRRRAFAACASVVFSAAALPWLAPWSAKAPSIAEERGVSTGLAGALPARASEAVAVETVDFGARPGSIFSVPGSASETTVVWLRDDDGGPSVESL